MNRLASLPLSLLALLALLIPAAASAQQPGQMDPAAMMRQLQDPATMERMMKEAEATERCMAGIDQKQLDALQKRAERESREIERLCKAGKKDEALAKALALHRDMQADPTVKKIRECTKGMTEMMRGMPWAQLPGVEDDDEPSDDDLCS